MAGVFWLFPGLSSEARSASIVRKPTMWLILSSNASNFSAPKSIRWDFCKKTNNCEDKVFLYKKMFYNRLLEAIFSPFIFSTFASKMKFLKIGKYYLEFEASYNNSRNSRNLVWMFIISVFPNRVVVDYKISSTKIYTK